MKAYKKIIILFLVFAVLAVTVYVLKNTTSEKPGPVSTDTPLIELFRAEDKDVKSFEILGGKYDYQINHVSDSTWELVTPKFDLDTGVITSLVYQVENIYALQEVAGAQYDPVKYGLDTPVTLKVNMKDGSQAVFYYGGKAPNGSGFYVAKKGTDKVYLVETYKAEQVLMDLRSAVNKVIFEIPEDGLTGLRLYKNGKLVFDIDEGEKKLWNIIAPIQCGSRSDLIEGLIPLLSKLEVQEFAAINVTNLKEYGLDRPAYAFDIRSRTEKVITILLGKVTKEGGRYAMRKGDNKVFIVDPAQLFFLDRPLKDMMEPFVALQYTNRTKKMVVTYGGKTDVSEIDIKEVNKKDVETFIYNGKDVSILTNNNAESLFKNYYASITGIQWYEYDLKVHPKYGNPVLAIQYTRLDGTAYKIEYIPKNKNYCYAFRDGVFTGLVVERGQFDLIKKTRKELNDEIIRRRV